MLTSTRAGSWFVAISLVATLGLGACGDDDDSSGSGGGDTGPSGDAPLYGSEEFGLTLEELTVRIEGVEAAIGECMAAAGFDYVPVDYDTVKAAMDSDKTAPGLSDEEYVAQYGFGFTTRLGEPDPVVANGRGEQNVAIFEALSEADQVAYERALYGENTEASFSRALEDEDFSEIGGCTLQAVEQFFADDELSDSYVNPADALVDSDPRLIAAYEDWSECVKEEGYEYDTPDALEEDLADRLEAILAGAEPEELSAEAQAVLAELQGYERAVAVVATECEEEKIEPVEAQIEAEIYGAPQN